MNILKLTATAILATTLTTTSLLASSHGNDLVHTREFQGVVYTMSQTHMALYTFDGDADGISNCYGDCAANWPPAILDAGSKLGENYTLIPRTDGTMQIAFRGKPLYLFGGDSKIGDISGDGVGGVWHLSN